MARRHPACKHVGRVLLSLSLLLRARYRKRDIPVPVTRDTAPFEQRAAAERSSLDPARCHPRCRRASVPPGRVRPPASGVVAGPIPVDAGAGIIVAWLLCSWQRAATAAVRCKTAVRCGNRSRYRYRYSSTSGGSSSPCTHDAAAYASSPPRERVSTAGSSRQRGVHEGVLQRQVTQCQ